MIKLSGRFCSCPAGTFMKKKILIVDDSKIIQELFTVFCQERGFEVAVAEDGLVALDVLEKFRPDIIFVDLVMPRINGEKLCRIIRRMPEYDTVWLVIISAIAAEEKIDFISLGADACIAKGPVKAMEENLTTVLAHLENRQTDVLARNIFGSENIFERDITRELLALRNHFEITLSNMDEGFLELTDQANIISANSAAIKFLGLPEEKLISGYFPDLFPDEQRRLIINVLAEQGYGIAVLGEDEPIVLYDNYLLIKFVPFFDQNRKFNIVLIHDITRLKQVEQELQECRERAAVC